MIKTLVTGATGTIGFNIANALLKQGRSVRVLVRDMQKARTILPVECDFLSGDVTNIESIEKAMSGCDIVHHAAGIPEQWLKHPEMFNNINVNGTKNMLDAAKKLKVKKFIYTSTIDVFKARAHEEYDESRLDSSPKGTFYERSKQQADKCAVAAMNDGLDVVFIHPSSVYGPGPDIHHAVGVNAILTKVKCNELPVLLPGGFPVVYSENIGQAHVAAEQKPSGSRYIISDQYVTLLDLVTLIHKTLNITRRVPRVMPVWVGRLLAIIGESVSSLNNKKPLIAKGELTFLQWRAIPNGQKAKQELGIDYVRLPDGLRKTVKYQDAYL